MKIEYYLSALVAMDFKRPIATFLFAQHGQTLMGESP